MKEQLICYNQVENRNDIDGENDCTVLALCAVENIAYKDAFDFMAEFCGREKGKGVLPTMLESFFESMGYATIPFHIQQRIKGEPYTLRRFLDSCDKNASYYISGYGHAFAVVKGKIYDHQAKGMNAKVFTAYKKP